MVIFAFDRDWTVNVNPHPRHEAVPLDWVRYLAHETDHPVYAIGNQALAEEAAVPGVVDVVGRHSDDWDDWLGGKQQDGRYERFPDRRERLALIADLHPEAESYVVVDDIDLSDVTGWDHYHAWEFVPAVRQGEIDRELPWVREPTADGGYPVTAGIVPTESTELASFLDDVPEGRAYELTISGDGAERTELLWSVSIVACSLPHSGAQASIRCVPLDPAEGPFDVSVDDVEMLNVIDPPPEAITAETDAPAEEARCLRRRAQAAPRQVRVSPILMVLDSEGSPPEDALKALKMVAKVRPEDCRPAIPILWSLLESEEEATSETVLATLGRIADESPGDVAPLVDEIVSSLESGSGVARSWAAQCVSEVADEDPTDTVEAVPQLAPIVENGGPGQSHAVYALSCITREYPEAVAPVADVLSETICDDALSESVRLNATAALGRVVKADPDVGLAIVEDVVALFDADAPKLRANAVGLVADLAAVHTDVVEPHAGALAACLTADDAITRSNATSALARVAEDFPDTVARWTDQFVTRLDDEDPVVRKNACWALGHVSVEATETPLADRVRRDDDEEVRRRAEWALHRIRQ